MPAGLITTIYCPSGFDTRIFVCACGINCKNNTYCFMPVSLKRFQAAMGLRVFWGVFLVLILKYSL